MMMGLVSQGGAWAYSKYRAGRSPPFLPPWPQRQRGPSWGRGRQSHSLWLALSGSEPGVRVPSRDRGRERELCYVGCSQPRGPP